ncbi:hypothetical protein HHK36_000809 [Tetracentron sinense]|uniref:CDC20/Fizzy WD40 domain-containing protein n=1 Tax=Tetracentron sinense TaxID=13715 RepID=A0A835A2G1_TETSI|nr:hypothetical protein HHK36_000809 [Tetracentron sinense]
MCFLSDFLNGYLGFSCLWQEEYRRKLEENLTLDSEGRPFRMLVFRGSPKSCRKSIRLIDEMRQDGVEEVRNSKQLRRLPKTEARVLDAPKLKDDFYLNLMDWGKNNILAVALGSELYLWNAENSDTQKLVRVDGEDNYPSSVAWSEDAKTVAVGHTCSKLQLWDAETSQLVRSLEGHQKRVGTLSWNGHLLTSGSHDKSIINHDVRAGNSLISCIRAHTQELCGLKWSSRGNLLASGGNDNVIHIWEASKMSSSRFLHQFNDHRAAVKALAWCPYQDDILASGGGTSDRCIKIWNLQTGKCINSLDTKGQARLTIFLPSIFVLLLLLPCEVNPTISSMYIYCLVWFGLSIIYYFLHVVLPTQVCGLEWNRHHKEILSGHGFSPSQHQNQLCLWRYPSMSKVGELRRHASRVLHLTQSPDGLTVVSAGADETLRFWEVFGPPQTDSGRMTDLDSLLSLKRSAIR